MSVILFSILLAWFSTFDCATAFSHQHNQLRDVEINISSWNGCAVNGTINGTPVSLFMDVASCPLHAKVPGTFRARIDQTCGAILEITDGPTISTPMPPSCPSPSPTPLPSADNTKGAVIIDAQGNKWTIGPRQETLRNGIRMDGGSTTLYKYSSGEVYAVGQRDGKWYKWVGTWSLYRDGLTEPGIVSQPTPSPTPTPTPSPTPVPTPTPAPTPIAPQNSCAIGQWCYWLWPSSQEERVQVLNNAVDYGCDRSGSWVQTGSYVYCVRVR